MKTYRPIIQDGELFGREVNQIEKPEHYDLWAKYGDYTQYGKTLTSDCLKWQQAEQNLKTFKVDKSEYEQVTETRFWTTPSALGRFRNQLLQMSDTFRADLNDNNQLINLNII